MSVRIELDQHNAPYYTNLDYISGRVLLGLVNDATISAINVKLEGESRTRLEGPRDPRDRREKTKVELEIHKLLYKVQTVFPGPSIAPNGLTNGQYTLARGQYEWPFKFKFPFNNDCKNVAPNVFRDIQFGQLGVQLGQDTTQHVKKALPPTLGGFPGEAEIRYFVKATVKRPKFYQENLRVEQLIRFLPIESPRPMNLQQETYARRQHQFQPFTGAPKKSLFRKAPEPAEELPLSFRVDARLPNPPILTCHQPLPLRILFEKLNDSTANVYVSMLQIELLASTNVRAHDLKRNETNSWILFSKANMHMVLDNPTKKSTREFKIPSHLWENIPLPSIVAPSFDTCNISRQYELEVRVGVTHGMADGVRPELIVLPLRMPVQVYSGIAPPPQLLSRLATGPPNTNLMPTPAQGHRLSAGSASSFSPITPTSANSPALPGVYSPPSSIPPDKNDAPPSYEDAMAEDLAPVDGPRQHFESSANSRQTQPVIYNSDSKSSGGLNRHPSERLFSQNAPSPPGPSRLGRTAIITNSPGIADRDSLDTPTSAKPEDGIDNITRQTRDVSIGRVDLDDDVGPPLPDRKGTSNSINNEKGGK